jgi:hypothetical protein
MVVVVMVVAAVIMVMNVVVGMLMLGVRLPRRFPEGDGPNHDQGCQSDPGPEEESVKLVSQDQVQDIVFAVPGFVTKVERDACPREGPCHGNRAQLIEVITFAIFVVMMMSHESNSRDVTIAKR